jgi:hypothetical protein
VSDECENVPFRGLTSEAILPALHAIVDRYEAEGLFSGAVLVTRGGRELLAEARGLARRGRLRDGAESLARGGPRQLDQRREDQGLMPTALSISGSTFAPCR